MLAKVKSGGLNGVNGYIIDIEVDISNGLPKFELVGLPDTAVKESRERVCAAIKNSGYSFPIKKITVNMAPADTRKEGAGYDLAIAAGILIATGQLELPPGFDPIFLGELSLDGSIRSVRGTLPTLLSVANEIDDVLVPSENAKEATHVQGVNVYKLDNIKEMMNGINGSLKLSKVERETETFEANFSLYEDFADVKGQEGVKRALEISAAGAHNLLMIGPPGSGKTMLAKRLPGILPELTYEEAIEITKIYSAAGLLDRDDGIIKQRPFRTPHHTISNIALVGGGRMPNPGEVSLAHYGVLFLDEMPEFKKDALEVMRQPLEDGQITISRANGSAVFPAKFMLVGSMNPCPCGYLGDPKHECSCTPFQIKRYLGKLSGPLLDRFDIHVEVPAVDFDKLNTKRPSEKSADIRTRVDRARKRQLERYKDTGIYSNSQLSSKMVRKYCELTPELVDMMKQAFERLNLSARAYDRILKLARTIADIEDCDEINRMHLAEAIQYRSLDRNYWER